MVNSKVNSKINGRLKSKLQLAMSHYVKIISPFQRISQTGKQSLFEKEKAVHNQANRQINQQTSKQTRLHYL